jgi:hypothetical protein
MATLGSAYFVFKSKDNVSPVAKGIVKQLQGLGKTGKAVFGTLAAAGAAAGAAIAAAAGVALKLAKDAVSAAIEDNKEQEKLISILKARGVSAEVATKRTNQLIEAGQKLAFTDSETRAGYAIATQFTKKYAAQQKILTVAQDFARAKNISLAKATAIVGKAFAGNGKALKTYGIELGKGVKGNEAIEKIQRRVAGVAEAYSKTFAGQFDIIKDSVDETLESIGYAIGGGEGLPTFTRLLEGIRPVVEDLLGSIKDSLPDIQSFSRNLVEKFLAKLPTYVATAKRELPILIDKAKEFIGSVAGFAKDIGSFMGPDGLITVGLGIIGTKFGGLAGGIGAIFAEQFIKMGVDPITASITATLAGAITAGIVQGFASQVAIAAVNTFLGLFKRVPVTPSIPVGVPGGGAPPAVPVPGGGGISGIVKTVLTVLGGLGIAFTAQTALQDQAVGAMKKGEDPLWKTLTMPWTWPGAIGDLLRGGPDLTKGITTGIETGLTPLAATLGRDVNFTNNTTLILDGRVVAESVNRHLGLTYGVSGPTRTGGR